MFYNHPGAYFHLSYPRNCRVQPYTFMPPSLKIPSTATPLSTALGRPRTLKDKGAILGPNHYPHKVNMPDSNLDQDSANSPDFPPLTHRINEHEAEEQLAGLRMQGSSYSANDSAGSSMAESIHKSMGKTDSTNSSNSKSPRPSISRNSSSKSSASKADSNGSGHTFGGSRTKASPYRLHPPASLHPVVGSICRTNNYGSNYNNSNNSDSSVNSVSNDSSVSNDNSDESNKDESNKDGHNIQSHNAPRHKQIEQPPPGNLRTMAAKPPTNINNNKGAHGDALICEKGERHPPRAPTLHAIQAPLGPSPSAVSVLLDDIQQLKAQILQATLVLTHVVQTMSVPSPAALLDIISKRGFSLGKDHARDEGCHCARLHIQQDCHGLHFLVAYYSPDPWEFQSRILGQIARMQQELDTLRQESLEVQKRATIQLREVVMDRERSRDVEWVELNERMQNTFMLVDDDGESSSECFRGPFKKGPGRIRSDDSSEESEGRWARVDENRLLNKRDKDKSQDEQMWKTKVATIHNTWAGAVTPLAGGPLFPNKAKDEEGLGREVFWAGDYSSSQFSPIPSAARSKEE